MDEARFFDIEAPHEENGCKTQGLAGASAHLRSISPPVPLEQEHVRSSRSVRKCSSGTKGVGASLLTRPSIDVASDKEEESSQSPEEESVIQFAFHGVAW